jgi:hypothetical protein
MIIFDKFGDGQSERNRSVHVFPNSSTRIVIPVSPLRPLALLALTKEGANERHPSRISERLSCSALVAPSAVSTYGWIADSLGERRVASHEPRTPLSNRELDLLEPHLSHCKQRKATVSNRELSTNRDLGAPPALWRGTVAVLPRWPRIAGRGSRPLAPFLTGSASQTEFDVTPTKQKVEKFLTGARTAFKVAQFRPEFQPESQPQRESDCRSRDAAEQGKIPLHTPNEKELL